MINTVFFGTKLRVGQNFSTRESTLGLSGWSLSYTKRMFSQNFIVFEKKLAHRRQRWKNIQACEQCLCNFFSSSGKICAKLYGILLEKWGMSQLRAFIVIFWQICDYLWRFMVLFGTFMALYALFGTFGLLHCFVENSLLSQFTHFFG